MAATPQKLQVPDKFLPLFQPCRYKIFYGGRGGAKSWSIARALVVMAYQWPIRVLCAREFQNSISDSVHRLLVDQIWALGLQSYFIITDKSIRSLCGAEFIFKGLRMNAQEIKSMEGIDIAWVEEAQKVSKNSWDLLRPTIRKNVSAMFGGTQSEIWVSFNPENEDDPTYDMFVTKPPPGAFVQKVNWNDNPWFDKVLDDERRAMLINDPEAYEWVWGGNCKSISDAVIFARRIVYDAFEAPHGTRFYYGMDFGFANDPSAVIRCFVQDNALYIDHEAFGYQVELDDLPWLMAGGTASDGALWKGIPDIRNWPIKADGSRPETISHLRRKDFNISDAKKWQGSVEDGITHLKGYSKIVIHDRCKHMGQEARLYKYKVDKQTGDVLPVIVDKHNHGWDALRYSLDGVIQQSGAGSQWERLLDS